MEENHVIAIASLLELSVAAAKVYRHLSQHIPKAGFYLSAPKAIAIPAGVSFSLIEDAIAELEEKGAIARTPVSGNMIKVTFPWVDQGLTADEFVNQLQKVAS